jgi:hypothetical protein
MSIRKTFIAALAVAIAIALSPVPELQAATLVGPGSQPGSDPLIQSVKMKKKSGYKKAGKRKMGKRKRGRRAASRGRGCGGTYMYRKKGKCMDARNK